MLTKYLLTTAFTVDIGDGGDSVRIGADVEPGIQKLAY